MPNGDQEDAGEDEWNMNIRRRRSRMVDNKPLKDALDLENLDNSSEEDRQEKGKKDMANKIREMEKAK